MRWGGESADQARTIKGEDRRRAKGRSLRDRRRGGARSKRRRRRRGGRRGAQANDPESSDHQNHRARSSNSAIAHLQVAIDDVSDRLSAVLKLAKDHGLRDRSLQPSLDEPRHRARAHAWIVTFLGEPSLRLIRDLQRDLLLGEHLAEEPKLFIDNLEDHLLAEARELDDRIKAVTELRREEALDRGLRFARDESDVDGFASAAKAHDLLLRFKSARVRREDDDRIAKVRFASGIIRELRVIHHLEQDIEELR